MQESIKTFQEYVLHDVLQGITEEPYFFFNNIFHS